MKMTVISVDRLLALLLGLRYRQVVTLKRTYEIVITLWVVFAFFTAMQWCGIIVTSLCLVISVFPYTKIFFTLRHHQNQVQGHVQQPNQKKSTKYGEIQKGSVHCNMAATDAGGLLSTLRCSGNFSDKWWTIFNSVFLRLELYNHFSLLKLIIKPGSLLLEATRSQTSKHSKTSAVPLLFDLNAIDQNDVKAI